MRKKKNNVLKVFFIILAAIIVVAGIIVAVIFSSNNNSLKYYNVKITNSSGELTLSGEKLSLAPNSKIVNRPITVNITNDSENCFLRARVVFENNSEDSRVVSFVSQLNYYVNKFITYSNSNYFWQYEKEDNAFYLLVSENKLRTVTTNDNDYIFMEEMIVPTEIEQLDSLNVNGDNVQVGENINLKVIFEVVQASLPIDNLSIEEVSPYFNIQATYSENGFVSENGYLISYNGTENNLILPKYVGEDYIIGVKENAINNVNLQSLIIPASFINFNENCFGNLTNLKFVSIKNNCKINLANNCFVNNANLDIYMQKLGLNYVRETYSNLTYINRFKQFTEVSNADISQLDNTISYLYAPNVTEFNGNFQNFTNLKVVCAPSLTKLNENMFKGLTKLIEVDTPNVLQVNNSAFSGCVNLLNVTLNKNLNTLGEYAFQNCSSLKTANFLTNLTSISKQAFRNCSNLTKISLGENVNILTGAFYNCSNLRNINVNTLTKIEEFAFGECGKLRHFKLNGINNLNVSEKAFYNSTLTSSNNNVLFIFNDNNIKNNFINLNDNFANNAILLKVVNGELSEYSGNIANLDLTEFNDNKITKINNNVFRNNLTLKTLIIPSSVKTIGNNFLEGADNLTSVTINNYQIPNFSENSFTNCKAGLTVFVPTSQLNLFKKVLENFDIIVASK